MTVGGDNNTNIVTGAIVGAVGFTLLAILFAFLLHKRKKKRNTQRYREEILRRLQEVAPEQVENIDEIMAQFEGKELELIEQLRLMKPR